MVFIRKKTFMTFNFLRTPCKFIETPFCEAWEGLALESVRSLQNKPIQQY